MEILWIPTGIQRNLNHYEYFKNIDKNFEEAGRTYQQSTDKQPFQKWKKNLEFSKNPNKTPDKIPKQVDELLRKLLREIRSNPTIFFRISFDRNFKNPKNANKSRWDAK